MKEKKLIIVLFGLLLIVLVGVLTLYFNSIKTAPDLISKTMPTAEQQVARDLSASLEVDQVKYQIRVSPGATVYDLMNNLQATQGLKFSVKDYPGMGPLIEEINGIKNDVQANKFWIYYINGQSANEGVSNYVIKNDDVITWKYEAYKF